jgi:hypothetical protein
MVNDAALVKGKLEPNIEQKDKHNPDGCKKANRGFSSLAKPV